MANWSGFTLTDVGADLQAKINAGLTTLKFTKVGVGSGSGSGSVNALTAMVHKEQDIGIGNVEANGNIVTINFILTNKGLGSAYQMRELGLFATDPDKGEVLFAYMTDSTPDTMPADGSATVVSQAVTLNIAFSNTGNVSATIDTGAFVTHKDLETHEKSTTAHSALMASHNADISSHPAITAVIAKILGDTNWQANPADNLKNIKNLLGFGGIVAQRLETNGYVKFANGFTIQWINATIISASKLYCDCDLLLPSNNILGVYTTDYDYSTEHQYSEPGTYETSYRPALSSTTSLRFTTSANVAAFKVLVICTT